MKISIIVPLYKGNKFVPNLLKISRNLAKSLELAPDDLELILVNDSPEIEINVPNDNLGIIVKKLVNKTNVGIHRSRINGLKSARGEYIIFLDQDDELITENYKKQYKMIQQSSNDLVVGNALYEFPKGTLKLYKNLSQMNYLIREKIFIEIRDVIVSPGQCIIRKQSIPKEWIEHSMSINGADDWFLWILMFYSNKNFACNNDIVYHHRSTTAGNLSRDLDNMYLSCKEMLAILNEIGYPRDKEEILRRSIEFKYLKDKKQLNLLNLLKYYQPVMDNIIYKLRRM